MAVPKRRGRVDEVKDTILKIQKNLQCPICLELLSDPYTTRCSHAFCRVCICMVISTSKRARCPLCKQAITKRSLNESGRLGEIIEAVKALEVAIKRDTNEELAATPHTHSGHEMLHPSTPVLHKVQRGGTHNVKTLLEQSPMSASHAKGCGLMPEPLLDAIPSKRVCVTSKRSKTGGRRTSGRTGDQRGNIECPGDQRSSIECPVDQRGSIECPVDQRGSIECPGDQRGSIQTADTSLQPSFQEWNVTSSDGRGGAHSQLAPTVRSNGPRIVTVPLGTLPHVTIVHETPLATTDGFMRGNMVASTVNTNTHSEEPIVLESIPSVPLSPPHPTSGEVTRAVGGKVKPGDQVPLCDEVQSGDQVSLHGKQLVLPCVPSSPRGASILPSDGSSPIIPLQNLPQVHTISPVAMRQLNFELGQANPSMVSHEPSTVLSSQPSPLNRSTLTHLPGLLLVTNRCMEGSLVTREDTVESNLICCPMPNENVIETVRNKEMSVDGNHSEPSSVGPHQETPVVCGAKTDVHHEGVIPASVPSPPSCDARDDTHPASLTVVPDSLLQRESAPQIASFINADGTTQPTQSSDPTSDEMTSQDVQILRKKMEEKQKEIEELEALLTHTANGEHVSHLEDGCVPISVARHASRAFHTPSSRTDQVDMSRPLCTPSKRSVSIDHSLVAKADYLLKALRQPIDQCCESKEALPNLPSEKTCSKSHQCDGFLSPSCHLSVSTAAECIGHTPQAHETIQIPFVCQKKCTPSVENNTPPLTKMYLSDVCLPPEIGVKVVLDADDIETESPPEEIPLLPKDHPFLTVSTSSRPLPQSITPFSLNTSVLATNDSSKVSGVAALSGDRHSQDLPPPKSICISLSGQINAATIGPAHLTRRTPLAVKRESNMSGVPKCKNVKTSDSLPLSLVGSGLTRAQLQQARIFAKKHGGRIADCYNGSTTHIVVNTDENRRCSRTLKYLQGIASGRWIVDHRWIKDSLENEQQITLPETMYEARGDHLYCVDAPQKARLSVSHGEAGLFARLSFFVMEGCTPLPKDQITKLIQLAGGKIVSDQQSCLVICDTAPPSNRISDSTAIFSSWVTDSLSHYKLLSVREYLAKKV